MTATKVIAERIELWAAATAGVNTFPENEQALDEALPFVICDVRERRRTPSGETGFQQYEQTALRIWTVRLMVMVAPNPDHQRTLELYDLTDELERSLVRDPTLGGRVESASPQVQVEFPGEVDHPSGMVAKSAFMSIVVGETE